MKKLKIHFRHKLFYIISRKIISMMVTAFTVRSYFINIISRVHRGFISFVGQTTVLVINDWSTNVSGMRNGKLGVVRGWRDLFPLVSLLLNNVCLISLAQRMINATNLQQYAAVETVNWISMFVVYEYV